MVPVPHNISRLLGPEGLERSLFSVDGRSRSWFSELSKGDGGRGHNVLQHLVTVCDMLMTVSLSCLS